MKSNQYAVKTAKARASIYRFLGGLYIMEVDRDQLANLKKMTFPKPEGGEDWDLDLKEGYALLETEIKRMESSEDLEDLAADYAKVFLAAGDASGHAAFPYESVYVNKKHQVGGSTQAQMKALYLERGWEPDPNVYRTMEDNIGLMLEYQGIICEEEAKAFEEGQIERAEALLKEQKEFTEKHLTNWVGPFTGDMIKFADRDFYKGLAKITNGFIKKEALLLGKGVSAWVTD